MATAQMIQDKLNGNQNPKTKEEYIVQYQAMYLALRKKIQQKEKLPENIKTEDDIVKFSEKALKEGYKHDGEQGHTNKSILTLQNTISKKDTDQYTPQTLSDYAASTGLSIMQKN